jgi:hypothetical protein
MLVENKLMQDKVSAEYIMRSDLTAQDVIQYKKLKGIGILISVKVNSNIVS